MLIDLYSDTATKPTPAMRRAIAEAEVGDEQKGEDPTVNRLQAMVAELLGKEAALFLPSGTMCNEIAVKVHTRPGDAILVDRQAHVLLAEAGGPALLSGVLVETLDGDRGRFAAEQVAAAVRPGSHYAAPTRLLCVEQTHNFGGGTIWPLAQLRAVCDVAHEHGLATHLDGARLMNAVVASGVPAREYAASFDSAWLDLSKGLGAPVGGVLAGSTDFIREARRYKHIFGGAMRQAGIIAAAGVHALEGHVERLAEDHANARLLAAGLGAIPGVRVENPVPETNIVFFDIAGTGVAPVDFLARIHAEGVRMGAVGPRRLRAVTHLDITRANVGRAVTVAGAVLADAA
ncbi:MAG: Low-specificity L-threonine aldolase [uncultured Thermomicrobiales bacterium]|uniref:Low-specificity L-threonine aldolase n=1 Tax=uncultured Thermomicrobiales bacterium TaxID=1645740 RepID=A0A6J4U9D4_9BACT|nr:MAG: Low-specificity L-threonine aldolase [uncultured Thermomicrobiales bacterium]